MFDNPGVSFLKERNGVLYGSDYQIICKIDFTTFYKKPITKKASGPLIGWGWCGDTIIAGVANTKNIYYFDSAGEAKIFKETPFIIRQLYVLNDTLILFTALDSAMQNDDFYRFNTKTKDWGKINDGIKRYNDGGFSNDGAFVDAGQYVIYYCFNMGKFFSIYKSNLAFLPAILTIDKNTNTTSGTTFFL